MTVARTAWHICHSLLPKPLQGRSVHGASRNIHHSRHVLLLLPFLLVTAIAATAQTVRISGQIRERSEYDQRLDMADDGRFYHLLRTRLGIGAAFEEDLSAFAELQDARSLGSSERRNESGIPAFDLREGYIEARRIGGTPFGIKVGRQTLCYGDERLLGEVDWSNAGQTFDAAVIRAESDQVRVDLIGAVLARHPYRPVYSATTFLTGIWGIWNPSWLDGSLQAYYLFDDPGPGAMAQNRHTPGVHLRGMAGGFDLAIDGALQLGTIFGDTIGAVGGIPIRANMVGIRLGHTIDTALAIRIGMGYDRISGDDPGSDTYGTFSTLYATNQRYYGAMGYFTDIPRETREAGLQHIVLEASASPLQGLSMGASLHLFSLVMAPGESGPAIGNAAAPSKTVGNEIDVSIGYSLSQWLQLGIGYSVFNAAANRTVLPGRQTTQWGYLTLSAGF